MEIKFTKNTSWGARYVLLILSKLTAGVINPVVRYKTIDDLANESSLSNRTVSTHIHELKELGIIDVERELIFGKGRGVNSYRLFQRFDLKIKSSGMHSIIIERVLGISDLTPIQKFILIILINEADDFGVVINFGVSKLIQVTGISRSAIKVNLQEMVRSNFLYGVTAGGTLPIFLGKSKSAFYLNFSRFPQNMLNTLPNKGGGKFEVVRLFNDGFKFIDIDVVKYFKFYVSKKSKKYLNTLNEQKVHTFLNIISKVVDNHSGNLLTTIKRKEALQDNSFKSSVAELKKDAFIIKIGCNIDRFNQASFKVCIDALKDYEWGMLRKNVKEDLFQEPNFNFDAPDELNELRRTLFNEVIYLINYYAFVTYFKLIDTSLPPRKYAIVRGNPSSSKQEKGFGNAILLQTTDFESIYMTRK